MKRLLHIICFLWFAFLGCKKEPEPTPPPHNWGEKSELTRVWQTYLDEATKQETFSINPMLNVNGDILMSNFSTRSSREPIKLYDGKTGQLKWEWQDYLRDEEYFFNNGHTVVNNALILSGGKTTYALDMVTGQTLWKHMSDLGMGGSPWVFSDGEYVYKGYMGKIGTYSHHIYRTKYNQMNWELVCTYTDSSHQFDEISESNISFGNNAKGERLMIFPLAYVGSTKYLNVLCCYNLSTKQFEWVKDYSAKYIEFRVAPTVISNGKLFMYAVWGVTWYLSAINIADGSLVWQITQPDFGTELFLYKGNLISTINNARFDGINNPVLCIDANTGSTIWEQPFTDYYTKYGNGLSLGFSWGSSNVFKNYLFTTMCNNLTILNLDNGNIVAIKSIDEGCLQYGVAINEQERVFYVQDRKYVNCFKIPEEVKY